MPHCKSPFFIWFTGRSGSTHLCDLLDSHPQVYCRKEDFCEVKIGGPDDVPKETPTFSIKDVWFTRVLFTPKARIDNPTQQNSLDYMNEIFSSDSVAAGFKLKFPNQAAGYPEIVEQLPETPGIKMIELIRENTLKQSISLRNVERISALGVSRSSNATESVELEPLQLDVDMAVKHARYFLRIREEFQQFTAAFDNVISVSYEQLCFEPEKTLPRILEFLDVNPTVDLTSKFSKTTPNNIRDAIANYEELVAAVEGTDLEKFLD